MKKMTMHPHGPAILEAMPDSTEKTAAQIAERMGRKIPDVRNAMDWLFANGYLAKRRDNNTNLNLYSNKQHPSEIERLKKRRWLSDEAYTEDLPRM